MRRSCGLFAFLIVSAFVVAADPPAPRPNPVRPDPNGPRPIAARDTVFLEDMTWMEVRDALRDGRRTILVATGGVEQNGPYLAAGKHNVILRATTDAIARKLGKTLVAPIVPFVPEGNIDPPSGHMLYPSTISVTEDTYERLLTDVCRSLRTHGFERIVLLGDSGGNQTGLKNVAAKLTEQWTDGKTAIRFIPEYYDAGPLAKWLVEQGIRQTPEGLHDDFANTAQMMVTDPASVRMAERIQAGNFRINGVDLAPAEQSIAWGKRIVDFRADQTVAAIQRAFAEN